MPSRLPLLALVLAASLVQTDRALVGTTGQTPARDSDSPAQRAQLRALVDALNPELREKAAEVISRADDKIRAAAAGELARKDAAGTMNFLLAVLQADKSAQVRTSIVEWLGRYSDPQVREALERIAVADSDAGVSLAAIERLRVQRMQETRVLLNKRLEAARAAGDNAGLAKLAAEQERWISLVRGAMLPSFMRAVAETFSLKPADQGIRFVAFGDFGTGSESQKQVAAAMLAEHRRQPFDFGVTTGDNFYSFGMESPTTTRWKKLWDELYDPLGIRFYVTLGNHDWGWADSPAAEILYSERSQSWRLPSPYYTFTAGPVQFFALDTNEVSEAQLLWLDGALKKSSARWKIVYGHHTIYSDGEHGDGQVLIQRLLPVLKGRIDVYLNGHDHVLNYVGPVDGIHFVTTGGGGASLYKVTARPRSRFALSANGFTTIEADDRSLKIRFIGADSKTLFEQSIDK